VPHHPSEVKIKLKPEYIEIRRIRAAAMLPKVVGLQHKVTANRELYSDAIPVGSPPIVPSIVEDLIFDVRGAIEPEVLEITFDPQSVAVSCRERLPCDEAKFTAVTVGNHDFPWKLVSRTEL